MSIGSTKFASEAYAEADPEKEARIVRTAAVLAFCTSAPVAITLFAFSFSVIQLFNVPEHLQREASLALKFASVALVLTFLNNIFNTPQLTRLRMDLNTFVQTGFRIVAIIATPIVIYLGGGVAGAVFVLMIAGFLTLVGHLCISGRLLPPLFGLDIEADMIRPLLKFGAAFAVSSVAALLLGSSEKFVLARATSVKELAYYSVAFTMASMTTLFSGSLVQSLIPAFAQLRKGHDSTLLNSLYSRGMRMTNIVFVPGLLFVIVIAKPFLGVWAGAEFASESSAPLYILCIGLVFNIVAFLPYAIILASGRSDILAKLYWIELVPYIFLVLWLTYQFGIFGAAAAWSIRVICDAAALFYLAKRVSGVELTKNALGLLATSAGSLLLPLALILYYRELNTSFVIIALACGIVFMTVAWKGLERGELDWFLKKINGFSIR